jgi:hypothetical protein
MSPDRLAAVENVLENVGPVILEHWHYCGSRPPDRIVFDGFEGFLRYLQEKCIPGDALHVWNYAEVCRDDNSLVNGKYPDDQGRTPLGGSY